MRRFFFFYAFLRHCRVLHLLQKGNHLWVDQVRRLVVRTVRSGGQHVESKGVAVLRHGRAGVHARIDGRPGIGGAPQGEHGSAGDAAQVGFGCRTGGTAKDGEKDLFGAGIVRGCQQNFQQFVIDVGLVGVHTRFLQDLLNGLTDFRKIGGPVCLSIRFSVIDDRFFA